jgi:hypothetical protein
MYFAMPLLHFEMFAIITVQKLTPFMERAFAQKVFALVVLFVKVESVFTIPTMVVFF